MFVFPLKWLPWILLIGGLIMMFSGEATAFSIILTIAAGIWIFYQLSGNKNKVSDKSGSSSNVNNTRADNNTTSFSVNQNETFHCPNCNNIENSGMNFCSKCGTKLK